jgi:C-terminal processing protease CtpA/Prc
MMGVPAGRPINPITKTDWEGAGVAPDVSVKPPDALETAEKLAAEKIESDRKSVAEKTKAERKPETDKLQPIVPKSE